jgi:hypothetical protein
LLDTQLIFSPQRNFSSVLHFSPIKLYRLSETVQQTSADWTNILLGRFLRVNYHASIFLGLIQDWKNNNQLFPLKGELSIRYKNMKITGNVGWMHLCKTTNETLNNFEINTVDADFSAPGFNLIGPVVNGASIGGREYFSIQPEISYPIINFGLAKLSLFIGGFFGTIHNFGAMATNDSNAMHFRRNLSCGLKINFLKIVNVFAMLNFCHKKGCATDEPSRMSFIIRLDKFLLNIEKED